MRLSVQVSDHQTWWKYEVHWPSTPLLQCPCRSRPSGVRWDPLDRWCTHHWLCCCHDDGCHHSQQAEKTVSQSELRWQEPAQLQLTLPGWDREEITVITCTHGHLHSGLQISWPALRTFFFFKCVKVMSPHRNNTIWEFHVGASTNPTECSLCLLLIWVSLEQRLFKWNFNSLKYLCT